MSYVSVIAPCGACGTTVHANPNHVPSIKLEGKREPLCRGCANRLNQLYEQAGKPTIPIHPDAYEAEPEENVRWNPS